VSRAEVIGSLLRPSYVIGGAAFEQGRLSAPEYRFHAPAGV
jgi:hypothetical protein